MAPGEEAGEFPLIHGIEEAQPGIVDPDIHLGEPLIAELVGSGGCIPEHRFEEAHHILRLILPPVGAQGVTALGSPLEVVIKLRPLGAGGGQISRQDMEKQAMVRGALHVGLPPEGIDTAAGHPHVAQEHLDHGHGADILYTDRMLGPAHGVHDRTGLIRLSCLRVGLIDLDQEVLGGTGNGRHRIEGVARVVFFELLEDASLIPESLILLGDTLLIHLKGPKTLVVALSFWIVAGKEPVFKIVLLCQDVRGVSILDNVLFKVKVFVQDILDHPAQKGDVGAGSEGRIDVRLA